jgi:isopentenyl diphosphate isomerase/L-lactate dehydrogenase-like FMN-dependent dehydrogenase
MQLHPTGEVGMYQAATATGTLMAVSQNSQTPQEDIAAAAGGPRWIQLYPSSNPEASQRNIQRYQDAGARAIIVTIDQQATRYDRADNNRRLGGQVTPAPRPNPDAARPIDFTGPRRYRLNVPDRMFYTWDALQQLQDLSSVPLLIKGVMTASDARICVDRGFDGIVVSNHGGRSMDYVPSTLEVLEEIVQEVGGAIPVLIDSGFRRGSDVFKALALGADAVCFGRAPRWGLGAFGPAGAERVLQILQNELREAMASTGRQNLAAIDRTTIRTDFR